MGGYSARYHAASLAAVFLALAIGILIGVGFGDDVVSGTTEDLEESLQSDVQDARQREDLPCRDAAGRDDDVDRNGVTAAEAIGSRGASPRI